MAIVRLSLAAAADAGTDTPLMLTSSVIRSSDAPPLCITGREDDARTDLPAMYNVYNGVRGPGPKKTGFSCPFGRVLLENGRVLNAKWTKSIQLEFF